MLHKRYSTLANKCQIDIQRCSLSLKIIRLFIYYADPWINENGEPDW